MSKSEAYSVTPREAVDIVSACYRTNTPSILQGPPGIGKTAVYKQAAEKLGVGCRIEEGSSVDITDVRGLILPNLEEKTAFFSRPAIYPVADDGKEGILLIDELGGCLPAVQKSLQSLYDLRHIGNHKLPEGWLPCATANRAIDEAGAFSLLTSFQDRMCMINVEPNFEQWKTDFAIPNKIHHNIISYLNFSKKSFYTFNDRKKGSNSKSFASPRTYAMASKFLYEKLSDEVLFPILVGLLGEGIAYEISAHRKLHKDLPDVDAIYAGKTNDVPKEPSALYCLSGALYGYLDHLPKGLSLSVALERLLEYTRFLPREFAVLTMKDVMVSHKDQTRKCRQWPAWAKEYRHLILSTGD